MFLLTGNQSEILNCFFTTHEVKHPQRLQDYYFSLARIIQDEFFPKLLIFFSAQWQ